MMIEENENKSGCVLSIESCHCLHKLNFDQFDAIMCPTRSRGINRSSAPCFKKTLPALCWGRIPIPSSLIIAVVAGSTPNSSAANFSTAVNGVLSGTLKLFSIRKRETRTVYSTSLSSAQLWSNSVYNLHFKRQFWIWRQCYFEGNFWFFSRHLRKINSITIKIPKYEISYCMQSNYLPLICECEKKCYENRTWKFSRLKLVAINDWFAFTHTKCVNEHLIYHFWWRFKCSSVSFGCQISSGKSLNWLMRALCAPSIHFRASAKMCACDKTHCKSNEKSVFVVAHCQSSRTQIYFGFGSI